ncbi:unnamed protein product [Candida verbasci]|uniref:Hap4 transcription factor heteromerisation domain-containing protein n=1 Tax=Candida verbasci TaxID=1227364 RepID=A0A9W4TVR0_9ASCO|nr:unnamed protein product [Candida verbasci]
MHAPIISSSNNISKQILEGKPTDSNICVKTSKDWVLPPRPKPGRKSKEVNKENQPKSRKKLICKNEVNDDLNQDLENINSLIKNCSIVDSENLSLKSNLLSLIHEYKHLKNVVLNQPKPMTTTTPSSPSSNIVNECPNVHKRSINEIENSNLPTSIGMLSLSSQSSISSPITHPTSPSLDEFQKFINIDNKEEQVKKKTKNYIDISSSDINVDDDSDIEINFEEEDYDLIISPTLSSELSRTTSPYSDYESHSLMSTLTRSTTVSSVNTVTVESNKPSLKSVNHHSPPYTLKKMSTSSSSGKPNNYFELPKYEENTKGQEYNFSITANDEYNMITDILEEKLMNNDINYYIDNQFTNDGFNW